MHSSDQTTSKELAALALQGWVSLNQFAKIVGISYPTASKLIKENKLDAIPVGGINRIYATEVKRFLREGNKVQNEGLTTPHSS